MEKVMILTPFYAPKVGGAETFAKELGKELSKVYDVSVCTLRWSKDKAWVGVNYFKGLNVILRLLPKAFLMSFGKKKVYALGLNSTLVALLLKPLFRYKVYSVMLALYDFRKKSWIGWLLNRAERVYTEGKTGEKDMIAVGVNPEKIIKFQHWSGEEFYPLWFYPKNKKLVVIFVGRPIFIKGCHLIKDIEKELPDVEFKYYHDIPHEELPIKMQEADIIMVPSLYSEGFPRTIIEAASCGCVVVCSNCGALPELVEGWGFVEEPRKENFLYTVDFLDKHRDMLYDLKKKTITYAKQNFSNKNAEVFI